MSPERAQLEPGAEPNDLRAELRRWFGFPNFRPGQEEVIRLALAGRDVLVVMPTGSGKSLCYQLPALLRPSLTIVVSPLIALMKDQVDALSARHPQAATFINSSLPGEEQARRLREAVAGKYRLLYVAPERLRLTNFRRRLSTTPVSLFAVDEAHCISEWGHDFRPDYLYLREVLPQLSNPPVMALTATATRDVQEDILKQLGRPQMERYVRGFNRPNLSFEVRYCPDEKAKYRHLKALLEEIPGYGLIYAGTRRDTEEIADFVRSVGHRRAEFYHAGLPAEQRTRVQEAFMSGQLEIVAATNAFGMGVDKSDLRFVIHFTLPSTLEEYYQEAGRAGRDGQFSRCVLLYSPSDRALQEFLIANDAPTPEELGQILRTLRHACRDRVATIAAETIEQVTGLPSVKVRVGISHLEKLGILTHLGDLPEGMMLELRAFEISSDAARESEAETRRRRTVKRAKLQAMVRYAETNQCRREFLLKYFADPGEPVAQHLCCDNHAPAEVPSEEAPPEATRTAHLILSAVTQPRYGLGRKRLAQMLKGSRAKTVGADLRRLEVYGALAQYSREEIEGLVDWLLSEGYLKTIGSQYPVLALTPKGRQALERQQPVALPLPHVSPPASPPATLSVPRAPTSAARAAPTSPPKLPDTLAETLRLFRKGLSLPEIARRRQLAEGTVGDHLARLIGYGLVDVAQVVPAARRQRIEEAIERVGARSLRKIREALGQGFDYTEIRCVLEAVRRGASAGTPSAVQEPPAAPAPVTRVPPPAPSVRDEVEDFLAADRPKPLPGPWEKGLALAFNAKFVGDRWQRTETGKLVYQLKYRGRKEAAEVLGRRLAELVQNTPELASCDLLVPIPPSGREREFDPVTELALAVSRHSGMPVSLGLLRRTRPAAPQKDLESEAQKRANVKGLFAPVHPERLRGKRVLLLDDFYDSGATLTEAAQVLVAAGARSVCVLTASKTIHHG